MVNLEEVVAKYEWYEGYELVDFRLIGIPVYRLVLDTIALAKTPLSALESYFLRCVQIGVISSRDIAETLGLTSQIAEKVVGTLQSEGYLKELTDDEGHISFSLTKRGKQVLGEDGEIAPEERTEFVEYDGWLRRAVRLYLDNQFTPKQIIGQGGIILPAIPGKPPRLEEIARVDVEKVLRMSDKLDDGEKLLEIKRINKRILRYRPAAGLVYRSVTGTDLRFAVILGNNLSEEHGWAFAGGGGLKRTDVLHGKSPGPLSRRIRKIMGEEAWKARVPVNEFTEKRRELNEALGRKERLFDVLAKAREQTKRRDLESELSEVVDEIVELDSVIQAYPVRPVSPLENFELLKEAIISAKHALMIDTTGFDPLVLRTDLIDSIQKKVKEGVNIVVRCNQKLHDQNRVLQPTVEQLKTMSEKTHLCIERRPKGAVFSVMKDDDFVLLSNRPFLKTSLDENRFNCQMGYIIRGVELCKCARELSGPVRVQQ